MLCPGACLNRWAGSGSSAHDKRCRHHREDDSDNGIGLDDIELVDDEEAVAEPHRGRGRGRHHHAKDAVIRGDSVPSILSCSTHESSRVGTKLRPVVRGNEMMQEKVEEEGDEQDKIVKMGPQDKLMTGAFLFLSFALVLTLCIWAGNGLLPEEHVGHVHSTKTRVGHVHSPVFKTPVTITLHGTKKDVFDVRLIGMAMKDFGALHETAHRRLFQSDKKSWFFRSRRHRPRKLATTTEAHEATGDGHGDSTHKAAGVNHGDNTHEATGDGHGDSTHKAAGVNHGDNIHEATGDGHGDNTHEATGDGHGDSTHKATGGAHGDSTHGGGGHSAAKTGTITYRILADGKEISKKTVNLEDNEEVEFFDTIITAEKGGDDAENYVAEVTSETSDGSEVAFLFQVLRMGGSANHRFAIGMSLFVVTFASIVAEFVHRSYSAAIGASACLCVLAAIQETPELHHVTAMIEWGTLMLLFSMMILMQMLAMTGFFNWFAVQVIKVSKQDPVKLFFLMTNSCGFMSMVLDNVTCVLLTGPLTYQLAKKMQLSPRPYYLSMTIAATVGGTATLIGDPPNIVIGSKLKLGFETFLVVNFPVVAFLLMPLCTGILYWRFKDDLVLSKGGVPKLNIEELEQENRIKDEPMFAQLGSVLLAVLLALLLSPVHGIEPSWFTVMAMFACGLRFDRHHMGRWLELVEWDTLFFFALLFVLVESLSELGVIRTLGGLIMSLIQAFPEGVRMYAAIIIILWVSGLGSAFLESLPYTTTMVYIILDLMGEDVPGVNVHQLVWPLSIGACVGGIGSIMGSSANLVCMAISKRNAETEAGEVKGADFLKFGFPTLMVLLTVATLWLIFLLVWCGVNPM